jgi:hypothetical protein
MSTSTWNSHHEMHRGNLGFHPQFLRGLGSIVGITMCLRVGTEWLCVPIPTSMIRVWLNVLENSALMVLLLRMNNVRCTDGFCCQQ